MPTPEEYAAERLAARAETYRVQVARLRALSGSGQTGDEEETNPQTS